MKTTRPTSTAWHGSITAVRIQGSAKIQLKALEHSEEPDPEILMHLGEIYIALDDPKRAQKYLKQADAIEDTPDDIKAKIRLS